MENKPTLQVRTQRQYASYYGSIFSRLKQQLERQTDSFGNVQNHTKDFVSSGFLFCQRHKKEK